MRKWAFIVVVLGMFTMVVLLNLEPKEIEDYSDLEGLELNTRVSVSGEVVDEKVIYGSRRVLSFDNGIEAVFDGVGGFEGEIVEIAGVVSEYEETKQIEVERIRIR